LKNIKEIEELLRLINKKESSLVIRVPVITGDETIGQVVISLSKQNIISEILKTVAFVVLSNIVVAIILAVIMFSVSRRIIFDPITALVDVSQKLARGKLSTRIDSDAIGEMRQLFNSFNQMAEDLQHTTVSKDYVNNIIKSMTEALIIVSPEFIIRDINDSACSLLGYEKAELSGVHAGQVFEASMLQQVSSIVDQKRKYGSETICRTKDGESIPIYFTASAMIDENGEIQGIVCTALDISAMKKVAEQLATTVRALQQEVGQRKEAQEEATWLNADLERQKSALETANKELESFCYSVSHDLRAPLRHINGFTSILYEDYSDNLDDTGRNYLHRICSASSHMGTLIDDLLRFSRVSRSEMKLVNLNLSESARRITEMFIESEPGSTASINIADNLRARGDSSLIDMVLQNLIGNAWKYSSKNPDAIISVGSVTLDGVDAFFVSDNGVGFDMAYKQKLFRVFERLHGDEFEGTGIGLATVQRIIERHGGRIWAESEVGKGATFYFTLE
jgi:PAS domain S-box-containing protein